MSETAQTPPGESGESSAGLGADSSGVTAVPHAFAPASQGFAPMPTPPQAAEPGRRLDEEIDRLSRVATEAALQAVAASTVVQKIDTLSGLVLDAAELANRSATAGAAAGARMLETQVALEAELARSRRHGKIVLGVAGGIALVSVVLTAAVVSQLASRTARLDATVLAVGKRYVEVSAGLEALTLLNDSLAQMQVRQDTLAQLQAKLTTDLEEASKASQGLVTQVPQATAKEVQARTAALMQQVQAMDSKLQAQGTAVRKMADDVKAMQGQQENLGALKRDVEALVVLQRERYLEAVRAAGAAPAPKGPVVVAPPAPRTVQYPRPQPPAPEGGAAAVQQVAPAPSSGR